MAEYRPGVCNIGADQRRKRRWLGVVSLLLAAGLVAGVRYLALPDPVLLVIVPFLVLGFLNVIQARLGFCAAFAYLERYDFSGSGGDAGVVRDKSGVPKDRMRAAGLVLVSIVLALLVTGAVYGVARFVV